MSVLTGCWHRTHVDMNVSVPASLCRQMLTALSLQDSWVGKVEEKFTMTRSNPQQLPLLFVSISGDIFFLFVRCLHGFSSTGTDSADSFLGYNCSRWRYSWNPSVKQLPQYISIFNAATQEVTLRVTGTTLSRLYHVTFVPPNNL